MNSVVTVASVATATAIAAPSIAGGLPLGDDPIFAAIERHRSADAAVQAAHDEIFERPDLSEERHVALSALLSTAPTTLWGCAAVLTYIGAASADYDGATDDRLFSTYSDGPIGIAAETFLTRIGEVVARAAPSKTLPPPTPLHDPVYAAIERHREAVRKCHVAIAENERLGNSLPDSRRKWSANVTNRKPPKRCKDAPEWIASELAVLASSEEECGAACAVVKTVPTTMSGAATLVAYVREARDVLGEFYNGETGNNESTEEAFLETLSKFLRSSNAPRALSAADEATEMAEQ